MLSEIIVDMAPPNIVADGQEKLVYVYRVRRAFVRSARNRSEALDKIQIELLQLSNRMGVEGYSITRVIRRSPDHGDHEFAMYYEFYAMTARDMMPVPTTWRRAGTSDESKLS